MDSNCKTKLNLDHVYCHPNDASYIRANTGSTEMLTILKENKQLKAMLLLHLDLIQEQSDQLMAKDKLLASLREENESLKLRLERIDKRLQKNRVADQKVLSPPAVSASQFLKASSPKIRVLGNAHPTMLKLSPPSTETSPAPGVIAAEQPILRPESKYKICDDNYNVDNNPIRENNGKYITKIVLQRVQSPGCKAPLSEDDSKTKFTRATSPKSPGQSSTSADQKVQVKDEAAIGSESEAVEDNFSCGSGAEQESSRRSKISRKQPVRYGNLTTKRLYCTREWVQDKVDEDLNREESEAMKSENPNLEIPKWTIKDFHGLYAIEGTEDLSDDVFLKRHNKLEIDEKRRKKWDVQRIREQRTIERLKRRHCKEEVPESEENQTPSSFYPSADSIKFIQITEDIPVTAFGEIIPRLKSEDFSLPWPDPATSHEASSGDNCESTSASTPTASSSMVTTATTGANNDLQLRKSNFPSFGSSTSFMILKKRRRQLSQAGSTSRRSNRKNVIKN